MRLVEIKEFNSPVDNKPFFDQPVKNKKEAYEKIIEMSRNDDYARGNILDFSYHQNFYEFIAIDWSRQRNKNVSLQINFTWKLEQGNGGTMLFIAEKQQKTILNFSLVSLTVTE